MNGIKLIAVVGWALVHGAAWAQESAKPMLAAKALPDAGNALDVPYLPERLTGAWEDRWVQLNVHWPKDGRKHPCIIFVHGGGYGGGDKDGRFAGAGGPERNFLARAVQQGFVVANVNYILGRDIFPQVFHDFRAIVRFLRANADTYRIDPDRIGVWGFSAGGWLASSACFTEAGDLYLPGKKLAIGEAWPADDPRRKLPAFALAMEDARPAHGQYSARVQALQMDFHHFQSNITSAAPALCTYVGEGGVSDLEAPAKAAGVEYTPLVLRHPDKKFDGAKSVHVPPLTMKVPSADGKGEVELGNRVLAWFKEKLIDRPATPVPEFRPHRRVFADQATIDVVMPSPGAKVHFTTDGSTPTLQSPVWDNPLSISVSTTLKAMAVRDGMKPSGVATARFSKGDAPPTIQGPKTLPLAKVGQPIDIGFSVAGERQAEWQLIGHYRPADQIRYKGDFSDFTGLRFEKGKLHGTPKQAGAYTLLIQAAWGPGQPADTRTYVLRVE